MWNSSLSNHGRNKKESMRAIVKSNKYRQTWAEKVQIEKKNLYTLYRNKNPCIGIKTPLLFHCM